MDSLWPWLAVAGLGALHGLSPTGGWLLAAAWGARSRDRRQALRALLPIAVGHTASVGLVGVAVFSGLTADRVAAQVLAGALLAIAATFHLSRHAPRAARGPAGHAGLALGSFIMSTAHGAGLMLVPALVPLCLDATSPRAAGAPASLLLALAAVGVHTAAMLAVTGLVATLAVSSLQLAAPRIRRPLAPGVGGRLGRAIFRGKSGATPDEPGACSYQFDSEAGFRRRNRAI